MLARPVATRRATLVALGAGVLVATGCDLDDLDPRPVPAPAGTTSVSEPDDDAALVDAAVASILATLAVVESVRGDAALLRAVRELDRLHRAHLVELDPDASAAPPAGALGAPDGVGRPGRRALLAQEQAHRAALADLAERAASGALAGVLASMSAAVAQRLMALAAPARDGAA